jgi:hypothetical protein
MTAQHPSRTWKGCCMMCGAHTLRGQGRSRRDPYPVLRKLGKSRRLTRHDLGDAS